MAISRILSLLVALAYVAIALFAGAGWDTIRVAAFLALPLACIWFCEDMGGYAGILMQGGPMARTPAIVVAVAGWIILLLPVILQIGGCFTRAEQERSVACLQLARLAKTLFGVGCATTNLTHKMGFLDQIFVLFSIVDVIAIRNEIAQVLGVGIALARRVALGFLVSHLGPPS